jgi:hypothetical protein
MKIVFTRSILRGPMISENCSSFPPGQHYFTGYGWALSLPESTENNIWAHVSSGYIERYISFRWITQRRGALLRVPAGIEQDDLHPSTLGAYDSVALKYREPTALFATTGMKQRVINSRYQQGFKTEK